VQKSPPSLEQARNTTGGNYRCVSIVAKVITSTKRLW